MVNNFEVLTDLYLVGKTPCGGKIVWRIPKICRYLRSPVATLHMTCPSWNPPRWHMMLDLDKSAFVNCPPVLFEDKDVVELANEVRRAVGYHRVLPAIKYELREWLALRLNYLVSLSSHRYVEPVIVDKVDKFLAPYGVKISSEKVAELCSILANDKEETSFPAGTFLVPAVSGHRIEEGDICFVVDGVHGFGSNVFDKYTVMKSDGTLGSISDNFNQCRAASHEEILRFLSSASVRSLLILSEILEEGGVPPPGSVE